jgi:hypothetical protein
MSILMEFKYYSEMHNTDPEEILIKMEIWSNQGFYSVSLIICALAVNILTISYLIIRKLY